MTDEPTTGDPTSGSTTKGDPTTEDPVREGSASDQPDVTPDPGSGPSADVTPGAGDDPGDDPGARPVDDDAPAVTQHVGQDESVDRAGHEDADDPRAQAQDRAGAAGATGIAPTTRRP